MVNTDDIIAAQAIEGWMHDGELVWLSETAHKYERIIEVGSRGGRSSRVLARCGNLTCIDINFSHAFDDNLAGFDVVKMEMDSIVALEQLVEDGIVADCIFLDGDHEYETLSREIPLCLQIIRPGGLLCGHDCNYPGVRKAIDEIGVSSYESESIWTMEV